MTVLRALLASEPVDVAVQDETTRRKKILIADMDSTMIDQECIDELADEVGLKEKVAAITARSMNGEIAFEPALRERVALLKNLDAAVVDRIIANRNDILSPVTVHDTPLARVASDHLPIKAFVNLAPALEREAA